MGDDAVDEENIVLCCAICCVNCGMYKVCDEEGPSLHWKYFVYELIGFSFESFLLSPTCRMWTAVVALERLAAAA